MDALALIAKYYRDNSPLHALLLRHSRCVAQRALWALDAHPEIVADRRFVFEAAMLHDIGVFLTDAPEIYCYGELPYICHGQAGADLLRREGFPAHARVAERHTGAGLSRADILSQGLPLPPRDFLPETTEEQLICWADKFYSKSHPSREKLLERVRRSMSKYGPEALLRFDGWQERFGAVSPSAQRATVGR